MCNGAGLHRACVSRARRGASLPVHALIETMAHCATCEPSPSCRAHPVAVLRADGLRLGASRRIPSGGDVGRRPVRASARGPRQARDRRRLPCGRQGALALRGDRVQGCRGDQAAATHSRPASSATRMGIHPAQIQPIIGRLPPSTAEIDEPSPSCWQPRRRTGRPFAIATPCTTAPVPLLLAGDRARAPHRQRFAEAVRSLFEARRCRSSPSTPVNRVDAAPARVHMPHRAAALRERHGDFH